MPRPIGMPFAYRVLRLAVLAVHAHIFGTPRLHSITRPFLELYSRPRLLHLDVNPSQPPDNLKELDPHPDERQIRLDTDRSFVLYPVGDAPSSPTLLFHFHPRRSRRR